MEKLKGEMSPYKALKVLGRIKTVKIKIEDKEFIFPYPLLS